MRSLAGWVGAFLVALLAWQVVTLPLEAADVEPPSWSAIVVVGPLTLALRRVIEERGT